MFPKKGRNKHPLNLKSLQSIPKDFGYYISWLSFPLDLHIFKGEVLYINRWVSQGLCGNEFTCQYRRYRRQGFDPWVRKIPWERKWQPIPVLLPGKSHGQRSLVGHRPSNHKELDPTEHMCMKNRWCEKRFWTYPFKNYQNGKDTLKTLQQFILWEKITQQDALHILGPQQLSVCFDLTWIFKTHLHGFHQVRWTTSYSYVLFKHIKLNYFTTTGRSEII